MGDVSKLFSRMEDGHYAKCELENYVQEVLGIELLGISFDVYDMSLEIFPMELEPEFEMTIEKRDKIKECGCLAFWINFQDGTQIYMAGTRKPGGINLWKQYNNEG